MKRFQQAEEMLYPEWRSDTERIVAVATQHRIIISLKSAEDLWDKYSDEYVAGWLTLPESDDELWDIINSEV